jgi:outer membrane receptor protein involved in Fe transport
MTGPNNGFLADFSAAADWIANLSATYNRGPLTVTGQVRFVSSGELDYDSLGPGDPGFCLDCTGTVSDNSIPAHATFNLSGSWDFEDLLIPGSKMQVFLVVNNLFDKDPPVAPGVGFGGGAIGGTNPIFFDTIGRAFRFGLRASFGQ